MDSKAVGEAAAQQIVAVSRRACLVSHHHVVGRSPGDGLSIEPRNVMDDSQKNGRYKVESKECSACLYNSILKFLLFLLALH
jgi:hypothetical protein